MPSKTMIIIGVGIALVFISVVISIIKGRKMLKKSQKAPSHVSYIHTELPNMVFKSYYVARRVAIDHNLDVKDIRQRRNNA